jgi:hypothetical protein
MTLNKKNSPILIAFLSRLPLKFRNELWLLWPISGKTSRKNKTSQLHWINSGLFSGATAKHLFKNFFQRRSWAN